jgi:hypothetical protein
MMTSDESTSMATESRTKTVDEFLAQHGLCLPTHVVDFALDMRSLIVELEALVAEAARVPAHAA